MNKTIRKLLSPFEKYLWAEIVWMVIKYIRNKRANSELKSLRWVLRKNCELFVNRMKVVRQDNSFANEAATLEKILHQLEIKEKFLVDIGAADGIRQSSTARFLNNLGWAGALIEYDSDSFSRLAFLYNDRQDLTLCKSKVSPMNIAGLLKSLGVPQEFGYLNIDIDSYDLAILREMLESDFVPAVISMEINETFPPEIYFEVIYTENHLWQGDHFFGCSLAAAHSTLKKYGYSLACMEYNNAVFVNKEHSLKIQTQDDLNTAFKEGYVNKVDRKTLFPWNVDMEFLLLASPTSGKIEEIQRRFMKYTEKYRIYEVI